MQAADRTSTITNTATPASRPGSVDDLVPGPLDELVPGSVDELVPGSVDDLVPGPLDELVPGSMDELAPGPLNELGSSANAQKECLPEFIVLWSRVNYYLSLLEK